jgi:hypothetical protein
VYSENSLIFEQMLDKGTSVAHTSNAFSFRNCNKNRGSTIIYPVKYIFGALATAAAPAAAPAAAARDMPELLQMVVDNNYIVPLHTGLMQAAAGTLFGEYTEPLDMIQLGCMVAHMLH